MSIYTRTTQPKQNDLYETPVRSLNMMLEHLDPSLHIIWEPFVGSGHSTRHMRSSGFQVTNGDNADFFQQSVPVPPSGMKLVLVSNPPFSIKRQILSHLQSLGMHDMALLLPAPVLFTKYFHEFCHDHHVQLVIHSKRCAFLNPETGKSNGSASFDVAWICVGLNLPRDINFPTE
jgi:hypothetical protein